MNNKEKFKTLLDSYDGGIEQLATDISYEDHTNAINHFGNYELMNDALAATNHNDGAEIPVVVFFKDLDLYIRYTYTYSSWDSDYYNDDFEFVKPEEKCVITYVKDEKI